jgi:hypothetical protein
MEAWSPWKLATFPHRTLAADVVEDVETPEDSQEANHLVVVTPSGGVTTRQEASMPGEARTADAEALDSPTITSEVDDSTLSITSPVLWNAWT